MMGIAALHPSYKDSWPRLIGNDFIIKTSWNLFAAGEASY